MKALALFAVAAIALGGCHPTPRDAHDVARAGVISVAAAVRTTAGVCRAMIMDAANAPDLTTADADRVMHAGNTCQQGVHDAAVALEAAAEVIDAWDAAKTGQVACATARATDALFAVVQELRVIGVTIPWELDEALQVGRFAGAGCKT